MNLYDLFGSGNAAGGLHSPSMGLGMDLYGSQPSSNLGLTMPRNPYADMETGTGMMPPSSFGEMPTGGMNMQNALGLLKAFGGMGGQPKQQQPQMKPVELPMGSNQNYEQLLKMYGVRGGGLLG